MSQVFVFVFLPQNSSGRQQGVCGPPGPFVPNCYLQLTNSVSLVMSANRTGPLIHGNRVQHEFAEIQQLQFAGEGFNSTEHLLKTVDMNEISKP